MLTRNLKPPRTRLRSSFHSRASAGTLPGAVSERCRSSLSSGGPPIRPPPPPPPSPRRHLSRKRCTSCRRGERGACRRRCDKTRPTNNPLEQLADRVAGADGVDDVLRHVAVDA